MPGMEHKEILDKISTGIDSLKQTQEDFQTKQQEENAEMKNAITKLEQKARAAIEVKDTSKPLGFKAARIWKAQAVAGADKISVKEALKNIYGNYDPDFVKEYEDIQKKASVRVTGNAGVLVNEAYYNEIFPILYNETVAMKLGARKVPMPNGNLNIRKLVDGATARWVGESRRIMNSQPRFGQLRLSSKKLGVFVVQSNDLFRSASVDADMAIRDDMISQLQVGMDKTLLYGRGTDFEPLGIANTPGITSIPTAPATVLTGDDLYTQFVLPLKQSNIPKTSMGWALPPEVWDVIYRERDGVGGYLYRDELKNGMFHGYKVIETNQVEADSTANTADVFFGSWDKMLIGDQLSLEMKLSEDGSYIDADGVQQNAFENDELLARGLMICDLGLIYGRAFTYGKVRTRV